MVDIPVCSIYVHIPLCQKKCDYCHFYVIPNKESYKDLLAKGIKLEWELKAHLIERCSICSIYFGGGTPALFGPKYISEIISLIPHNHCEITIEVNPEDASIELMNAYRDAGINRVSIGVQSLDDSQLKLLSRRHDALEAIRAVENAYYAGIRDISIDLMYDIPNQTLLSWQNTLEKAVKLPIQHLSLYNLTFEPQTVFFKIKKTLEKTLPSEDESLSMYQMAIDQLASSGFHQYEISAFCKNKQSIHNVGYWTDREFLGLGPSAYSYWDRQRFRNVPNINKWYQSVANHQIPLDDAELLSAKALLREKLVLRLRLMAGAKLNEFDMDQQTINAVHDLIKKNLLVLNNGTLKLTQKGIIFYDTVATELI